MIMIMITDYDDENDCDDDYDEGQVMMIMMIMMITMIMMMIMQLCNIMILYDNRIIKAMIIMIRNLDNAKYYVLITS